MVVNNYATVSIFLLSVSYRKFKYIDCSEKLENNIVVMDTVNRRRYNIMPKTKGNKNDKQRSTHQHTKNYILGNARIQLLRYR